MNNRVQEALDAMWTDSSVDDALRRMSDDASLEFTGTNVLVPPNLEPTAYHGLPPYLRTA